MEAFILFPNIKMAKRPNFGNILMNWKSAWFIFIKRGCNGYKLGLQKLQQISHICHMHQTQNFQRGVNQILNQCKMMI